MARPAGKSRWRKPPVRRSRGGTLANLSLRSVAKPVRCHCYAETSALSTIIIDDCSDGQGDGYVGDKGTWAESDEDNVWRITAWTPLLSDLDDDLQLKFLADGSLKRCKDRFLEGLVDASRRMLKKRARGW